MRRRVSAAATAVAVTAGLLAATPAYAIPTPSPNAAWPTPGQDVKNPAADKPVPLSGAPLTLQPDATRKPLVVVESGQERGGKSFTIPSDVLFDKDSARLSGNASANIDSVVSKLQDASVTGDVKIIGHTDDTGTKAHNMTLSKQRAKAVDDAMSAKLRNSGITLTSSGVGEAGKLVPNDSEAHRKRNRRVAIIYQTSSANPSGTSDFSIPLTQSVTKPADAPAGVLASAERSVRLNTDTTYKLRMDILGLHRQGQLLYLVSQVTLVAQNGGTQFDDIGRVYSGTEDYSHEDDNRAVLFDPQKKQQLGPLITGKGDVVGNVGTGDTTLGVGGIREGYLYFPAPTSPASKLSLYVPMFGTFDDLPIT